MKNLREKATSRMNIETPSKFKAISVLDDFGFAKMIADNKDEIIECGLLEEGDFNSSSEDWDDILFAMQQSKQWKQDSFEIQRKLN